MGLITYTMEDTTPLDTFGSTSAVDDHAPVHTSCICGEIHTVYKTTLTNVGKSIVN